MDLQGVTTCIKRICSGPLSTQDEDAIGVAGQDGRAIGTQLDGKLPEGDLKILGEGILATRREVGAEKHDGTQILVAPGEQKVLNARLTAAPSADVHGNHAVRFVVETLDAPHYAVDEESRFLAPRGG